VKRSTFLMSAVVIGLAATVGSASGAFAAQPEPGGINFQPAATEIMAEIHWFHEVFLLPMVFGISALVLGLLLWVVLRYNAKANPVPKTFTHNTTVEVIWTAIPIVILVVIAIPSFGLLYRANEVPEKVDMTIKTTGYQWYWGYEYMDGPADDVTFEARMLTEADARAAGKPRLLGTDGPLVVPVGKTVRLQVAANDVIHSWAMPSFGVKMDAVPGRLNETWFKVDKPGIYYGQCSELCGIDHAFMPIEVHAVTEPEFLAWVDAKKKELGIAEAPPAAPAPAILPPAGSSASPSQTPAAAQAIRATAAAPANPT
jgi:cytochrome c oxidase subunit II